MDWRTGPPFFPTAKDWFPATVIVDAAACTDYLVARARSLQWRLEASTTTFVGRTNSGGTPPIPTRHDIVELLLDAPAARGSAM